MANPRQSVAEYGKQFRERAPAAPVREREDEQESSQSVASPIRQQLQAQFGRTEVDMAISGEDQSPLGTFILAEWAMATADVGSLTEASPEAGARVHGVLHSEEWGEASAGIISRYATSSEPTHAHLALELIRRSRGQVLPTDVAARLSAALGVDVSDAVIHTDAAAAQAAKSVNAHAFATGSDVFFAAGKYKPGTKEGDELLAHELTHVVQDAEGRIPMASGDGLTVSTPNQSHEREAERAGRDAAHVLHDSMSVDGVVGEGLDSQDSGSVSGPEMGVGAAVHRQEAGDGPQNSETEEEDKKPGWSQTEWMAYFEQEIIRISDAQTAQRVLYSSSNRKRFEKSIWDAHCIHMTQGTGDLYERLNTISRTMPAHEFDEEIRPSIKRGVQWVVEQNEMIIEALDNREFNIVDRLLHDQQTMRSRMDFAVSEGSTWFSIGWISDKLNLNANVVEQAEIFEREEQRLIEHVESMRFTLNGLREYMASGSISEEFDAEFNVEEFDDRGIGVQDVTTSFLPYLDSKISLDHERARNSLGTMMNCVHEAIYAIEFGAEIGESASKMALAEAKVILSVWAGLATTSAGAAPTVLEKASRLWAIDVGVSISKHTGEAMVASEELTFGELLTQFAIGVGTESAAAAVCRIWSAGYDTATTSMMGVLDVSFNRTVGQSTAEALVRHLVLKTVTKSPGKLVNEEIKVAMTDYASDQPVTAKAADEVIGTVLWTEAAKPWIDAALREVPTK